MIRTRYAPSPTGFMHLGNLRTALYEFLIAKHEGGKFILRIEDTDQERFVEGAIDVIYETLRNAGLVHDEGPDIGGDYGPYVQSQRKDSYLDYAKLLVEKKAAYYCFCEKGEKPASQASSEEQADGPTEVFAKYDRRCLHLSEEEIQEKLKSGAKYVIRQLIPEGETTFTDEVYGPITVSNEEIEDQILIKSDGFPTYNFANVIDDHLMAITHIVRGCEYLSSTPKYNLLYKSFGWDIPTYIHLPTVTDESGHKLSKRHGAPSFMQLIDQGFLPTAMVNYIALLGFCPSTNQEIFTLEELIKEFEIKNISKSPSCFDMTKLKWFNAEHIKRLTPECFFELVKPYLLEAVGEGFDLKTIATWVQTRVEFVHEAPALVDFLKALPDYSTELYVHKKMKTTEEIALSSLQAVLPVLEATEWTEESIHNAVLGLVEKLGLKNGQVLWPIRTALSGKPTSPCGATELGLVLGRDESIRRIKIGIEKLKA